jgi:hypothetical protein
VADSPGGGSNKSKKSLFTNLVFESKENDLTELGSRNLSAIRFDGRNKLSPEMHSKGKILCCESDCLSRAGGIARIHTCRGGLSGMLRVVFVCFPALFGVTKSSTRLFVLTKFKLLRLLPFAVASSPTIFEGFSAVNPLSSGKQRRNRLPVASPPAKPHPTKLRFESSGADGTEEQVVHVEVFAPNVSR